MIFLISLSGKSQVSNDQLLDALISDDEFCPNIYYYESLKDCDTIYVIDTASFFNRKEYFKTYKRPVSKYYQKVYYLRNVPDTYSKTIIISNDILVPIRPWYGHPTLPILLE
jgi:hypothetical protein